MVGVDGVGGIFPSFFWGGGGGRSSLFRFFAFYRFSSLFFAFLRFSSLFSHSHRGQGRKTAIYCKHGNFTPTPSAPTPCKTSRTCCFFARILVRCSCCSIWEWKRGSSQKKDLWNGWILLAFCSFCTVWGLSRIANTSRIGSKKVT